MYAGYNLINTCQRKVAIWILATLIQNCRTVATLKRFKNG